MATLNRITIADDNGNTVTIDPADGWGVIRGSKRMTARRFTAVFPDSRDRPGPDIVMLVELDDDRVPQVREVLVKARPGGRGIRVSDMRDASDVEGLLRIAVPLASPYKKVAERPGGMIEAELAVTDGDLDQMRVQVNRSRRSTRRTIPDSQLGEVARVYQAAERAPVKAVATHFGIGIDSANDYVARARAAGVLEHSERSARAAKKTSTSKKGSAQ